MNKEELVCNCGFEAENREQLEEHIDTCESVGTDKWESITTR